MLDGCGPTGRNAQKKSRNDGPSAYIERGTSRCQRRDSRPISLRKCFSCVSHAVVFSICGRVCRGRGAGCRRLLRFIRETKHAISGGMSGIADGMRRPTSAKSRMACRLQYWTHRRPVDPMHQEWVAANASISTRGTAMKTRSHNLIRAFPAHPWGRRTARSTTRDAVPATRVRRCRFPGIRALRVLERLSFRTTSGGQRCAPSFEWARLFVPGSLTPIPLRACRAVSIAPDQYRRRPD